MTWWYKKQPDIWYVGLLVIGYDDAGEYLYCIWSCHLTYSPPKMFSQNQHCCWWKYFAPPCSRSLYLPECALHTLTMPPLGRSRGQATSPMTYFSIVGALDGSIRLNLGLTTRPIDTCGTDHSGTGILGTDSSRGSSYLGCSGVTITLNSCWGIIIVSISIVYLFGCGISQHGVAKCGTVPLLFS